MIGKTRRLNRLLIGEQKRCLLSPMDHGGWLGPVQGLHRPRAIVEAVIKGGANALLISPGFYKHVAPIVPPSVGIVLRVSLTAGLSQEGFQETPIASLETALRMDADAIVVSVFFGRSGDIEIYRWLASLIDSEVDALMKKEEAGADSGGDRSRFEEEARRRVSLGLLISEIIQRDQLQVDPERVRQTIENLAQSYEKPEEVVQWYYSNQEMLAGVQTLVMEDTVVEWISGKAKVEDTSMSFDELMQS